MKLKRFISIFTIIAMVFSLFPNILVAADKTVKYRKVAPDEEIVEGAKYIIVGSSGLESDDYSYYSLGNATSDDSTLSTGKRTAVPMQVNSDDTLSIASDYSSSIFPCELKFTTYLAEGKYKMQTVDGFYLSAFYSTVSKTYEFDHEYSKSLPINYGYNGFSQWQPIFRSDGSVLFKTGKKFASSNYTEEVYSYIRFYHYISGSMSIPVFTGGYINDSDIDLPVDEEGNYTLTTSELTEENIPVNTYLYKEVCSHSDTYLTHTEAKESTCSEKGNIEYYYCSNCCSYLKPDKTTEIKFEDTVLPLSNHINTIFYQAKEPTCTESGNIAYTYCEDCGLYFEGNSTDTVIDKNDTILASVSHSYIDGVCQFCGQKVDSAYFNRYGTTGDGYRYIFVAKYNDKYYAMGEPDKIGMKAVEVTEISDGKIFASSENIAFTEDISYGESIKLSGTSTYYTPRYVKIGENYLKNDNLNLTLTPNKEIATYWYSNYGYDDEGNYSNFFCDNPNYNAAICLVTDEGEPYFSVTETVDDTHIKAGRFGELCSHKLGLSHTPGVSPTCIKDGNLEYWYCSSCNYYFSDSEGINVINEGDIQLLAKGALDTDNDGICDLCGRTMPIYTKVTNENEIVMGNKYILVTEINGSLYALKTPEPDKSGYYYDLGSTLEAIHITPEEDGKIKFNSAYNKNAFMFKLGFACECSELDQGTVRHELRTAANNKSLVLESNGGFVMDEYAKYGWRIGLNDDGSAKMSDAYDESLEDWNNGNGKLCVYKLVENDTSTIFFSASDSSEYTKDGSITRYPVYLYRLTETGKVNDTTYFLNDSKSSIYQNIVVSSLSEAAGAMSNVEGVSLALKSDAIESFVSQASLDGDVRMNVDVNITLSDFVEADSETKTGGSITFTISPKMVVTNSENQEISYDISDDAFDGTPMKVTLYTGGIEPQQIIHIKQDGTKEYFYQEWSEEVQANGEKSFTTSYDNSGNIFVTFSITEFSDIKILQTPETPSTGAVDINGDKINDYTDAAIVLRYICGMEKLTDEQISLANVNGGEVDITDVVDILKAITIK
ncbi:MAG: dockerin type I repeat-containing protein [Lachnospirales bacterium]